MHEIAWGVNGPDALTRLTVPVPAMVIPMVTFPVAPCVQARTAPASGARTAVTCARVSCAGIAPPAGAAAALDALALPPPAPAPPPPPLLAELPTGCPP